MKGSPRKRFDCKVKTGTRRYRNTRCREWVGAKTKQGYGWFWDGKQGVLAHRWIHEQEIGPIPHGYDVDHLCRNKLCVNALHLEAVPHVENMRRGTIWQVAGRYNAAKTHCPRGHEYTPENTSHSGGSRRCRTCKRERDRIRRMR